MPKDNVVKKTPLKDRGLMPVIILTLIAMACVTALAAVSGLTMEARKLQDDEAKLTVQRELFPAGDSFTEISTDDINSQFPNVTQIVKVLDKAGEPIGYVITAEGAGYGGPLPATVGFDLAGDIVGARFEVSDETAGYGQNAAKAEFYEQFTKFNASQELSADKSSSEHTIDALTGSTRSTNAILDAINEASGAFLLMD